MMDKFRVGQKVRIIRPAIVDIGKIVTVTSQRHWEDVMYQLSSKPDYDYYVYELDDGDCAPEDCLEPISDGDEKSSWSECAWKPKELCNPK
jgi:hypothetical protein